MAMDKDTIKKLEELLKTIDSFLKEIKPLRNKLARSLGQQKRLKHIKPTS